MAFSGGPEGKFSNDAKQKAWTAADHLDKLWAHFRQTYGRPDTDWTPEDPAIGVRIESEAGMGKVWDVSPHGGPTIDPFVVG